MKQAVFFDIDGTLWDDEYNILESTKEAIRKLRKNGHYALICSGRSKANICDERLLEIGFDGIIAGCGTYIEFDQKVIYEKTLHTDEVLKAKQVMKSEGMSVLYEGNEYLYADMEDFGRNPYMTQIQKVLGDKLKTFTGNERQCRVSKMSVECNEGSVEKVAAELADCMDVIDHGIALIEVVPLGHSKATGIQKACEYLNIPRENTYAFGDSINDLDMLSYVEHGIAMGNGTKEAKEASDYVTSHVKEDGIAAGLRHFNLI